MNWFTSDEVAARLAEPYAVRVTDALSGDQPGVRHHDGVRLLDGIRGARESDEGTLYIADSVGNRITAVPNAPWRFDDAGTGRTVTSGGALNTPLGLAPARDGEILSVNAGDGNLVATTPGGTQTQTVALDTSGNPPGAGALFGLAVNRSGGVYYVDDATNTLNLLR